MQTFLPYESFRESAKVLDWRRLGKQRVEGMQIINAIEGKKRKDGKPYKGWLNHPCTVMWRPYLNSLKHYTNIIITEWMKRGYNNNMEFYEFNDMVKPHSTIIDVGINRIKDSSKKTGYRLIGDVDFENIKNLVDNITPVPGGVGPMTRAMLLENTLKAYDLQTSRD